MNNSGSPFATSYFSAPADTLDPTLFEGRHLKGWVRQGVLSLLYGFLGENYRQAEVWSHAWLAGSGVSYQWSAARQPGDLDCLVGVNYVQFRKANPEFAGLGDREISEYINEGFRSELQPKTADWNGYELTFYVNPGATDIRAIKPYAAYDVKYDEWTVSPDPSVSAPYNPAWEAKVSNDRSMATQITTRFTQALNDVSVSHNDATRRNAENRLLVAAQQGSALFDEIHHSRALAFSSSGEGYADFHNYRWQAGKREGTIQMLRNIKEHATSVQQQREKSLYGTELPDAHSAIRYAAIQGAKQ